MLRRKRACFGESRVVAFAWSPVALERQMCLLGKGLELLISLAS
jgi:hypothetical protein